VLVPRLPIAPWSPVAPTSPPEFPGAAVCDPVAAGPAAPPDLAPPGALLGATEEFFAASLLFFLSVMGSCAVGPTSPRRSLATD
jgi:hypothetical protein